MRVSRLGAITVSVLAMTGGMVAGGVPAAAAAVNYVALGDSYSSGTGAGSYDPAGGNCQRSANAYPRLWAASRSPDSFSFVACAGATTSSVSSGQLSALGSSTTLVSITVGGNDAGFSTVMQTCVLQSVANCETAVRNAETFMQNTLPGRLDSLYDSIRDRAPSASVVVLGYPRLYTENTSGCVGIGETKRTALNRAADTLNTSIAKEVAEAGFTFSDVRDEFAGHELCSGDGWLNSVTWPIGNSYHPTALGHANGYYPAMSSTTREALARHRDS